MFPNIGVGSWIQILFRHVQRFGVWSQSHRYVDFFLNIETSLIDWSENVLHGSRKCWKVTRAMQAVEDESVVANIRYLILCYKIWWRFGVGSRSISSFFQVSKLGVSRLTFSLSLWVESRWMDSVSPGVGGQVFEYGILPSLGVKHRESQVWVWNHTYAPDMIISPSLRSPSLESGVGDRRLS